MALSESGGSFDKHGGTEGFGSFCSATVALGTTMTLSVLMDGLGRIGEAHDTAI